MRNYAQDYPGFVNPPDAAYPQGSPKNATTDTAEDGTPVEQGWVGDVWGFNQSIMAESGVAPNGQTESVSNPQILTALKNVISNDGKSYREVSPINNDYNGYLDPSHTVKLLGGDTSEGTRTFNKDQEISFGIYSGSDGNQVTFASDGWIWTGSIYKKYEYTAEQIALIDVDKVPVFIKSQDGKAFYFKNGNDGVVVSKAGTTLTVTLDVAIFGVTGIDSIWRFFVTDKIGSVVELSPDALISKFIGKTGDPRVKVDVTGGRVPDILYPNTTNHPMVVTVVYSSALANTQCRVELQVDGYGFVDAATGFSSIAEATFASVSYTINPGESYLFTQVRGSKQKVTEYKVV